MSAWRSATYTQRGSCRAVAISATRYIPLFSDRSPEGGRREQGSDQSVLDNQEKSFAQRQLSPEKRFFRELLALFGLRRNVAYRVSCAVAQYLHVVNLRCGVNVYLSYRFPTRTLGCLT